MRNESVSLSLTRSVDALDGKDPKGDWNTNFQNLGHCNAWVDGVIKTNLVYQGLAGRDRLIFCVPQEGTDSKKALRILVRFLKRHEERLSQSDIEVTLAAFREAWPCRSNVN